MSWKDLTFFDKLLISMVVIFGVPTLLTIYQNLGLVTVGLIAGAVLILSRIAYLQGTRYPASQKPGDDAAKDGIDTPDWLFSPAQSTRHGVVKVANGDALYGNDQAYNQDLYYGRLAKDAEILLLDNQVYLSVFNERIIKVKVLKNKWPDEVGKIGWIGLSATSFVDFFDDNSKSIDLVQIAKRRPAPKPHPSQKPDVNEVFAAFDELSDLIEWYETSYAALMAVGGEAVDELEQIAGDAAPKMQSLARRLLLDICETSAKQYATNLNQFICTLCLTRFECHEVQLAAEEPLYYFGCRLCRQTQEALQVTGPLVAILDNQSESKHSLHNDTLYLNWHYHRRVFDFESVEIKHASEEDVERFAVQVGNDTDPLRVPGYKQMRCTVSKSAQLTKNSLHILRRTFGEVVLEDNLPQIKANNQGVDIPIVPEAQGSGSAKADSIEA